MVYHDSFQQISQRLRDMAVSESARSTGFAKEAVAAANSIDSFPIELQEIVNQVAVNIHGVCVPKSSPDHPQYDPFRFDLFQLKNIQIVFLEKNVLACLQCVILAFVGKLSLIFLLLKGQMQSLKRLLFLRLPRWNLRER